MKTLRNELRQEMEDLRRTAGVMPPQKVGEDVVRSLMDELQTVWLLEEEAKELRVHARKEFSSLCDLKTELDLQKIRAGNKPPVEASTEEYIFSCSSGWRKEMRSDQLEVNLENAMREQERLKG